MPEADKLNPAQAAHLLDIAPRTLRRWSSAFERSLGESASRKGKKRFYTGPDIEILRMAAGYLAEGKKIAEVAELLPEAELTSTESALILAPEQNIALGQALERTRHLGHVSEDHEQRIKDLEAEINRLRWERLPFWKKLRTPPPD